MELLLGYTISLSPKSNACGAMMLKLSIPIPSSLVDGSLLKTNLSLTCGSPPKPDKTFSTVNQLLLELPSQKLRLVLLYQLRLVAVEF